ncbi:MAG: ribbon-helix-helix domain-containing protein [Candidatus Nanoarchaeia archaeon]|nr:ribbon-helix-helix domain-containing protein [Candidatus Nanoarchaeia archaeon]
MRAKYTNIAIPEELAKEIDECIKKSKFGFRSRAEFAIEAIRAKLKK